jgi:hypothetical protein
MSMFKRFRDSATGLFTTRKDAEARPGQTQAMTPGETNRAADRRILRAGLMEAEGELPNNPHLAYSLLRSAVRTVIDRSAKS